MLPHSGLVDRASAYLHVGRELSVGVHRQFERESPSGLEADAAEGPLVRRLAMLDQKAVVGEGALAPGIAYAAGPGGPLLQLDVERHARPGTY